MGDKPTEKKNTAELQVVAIEGKTPEYAVARGELEPEVRHAALALNASADLFAGDRASVPDMAEAMRDLASEAASQDLSAINRVLTAQALSLDTLFTQMVRRAHLNLGQFPDAADRYLRLALKAQAQSRTTLETLVKMHQPREQTVRHIHVGPDGQAVFIENYNGGMGSARYDERPHAQCPSGPAMLGHDTVPPTMPVAGDSRAEAVPHARRNSRQRRPARK